MCIGLAPLLQKMGTCNSCQTRFYIFCRGNLKRPTLLGRRKNIRTMAKATSFFPCCWRECCPARSVVLRAWLFKNVTSCKYKRKHFWFFSLIFDLDVTFVNFVKLDQTCQTLSSPRPVQTNRSTSAATPSRRLGTAAWGSSSCSRTCASAEDE